MKEIPFNLEKAKAGDPILKDKSPCRLLLYVPGINHFNRVLVEQGGIVFAYNEQGLAAGFTTPSLTMAPKKHVVWVNMYPDLLRTLFWLSRAMADIESSPDRIACLRIEFTEGEGLEESK